jgi:predicted phosphodiesterase
LALVETGGSLVRCGVIGDVHTENEVLDRVLDALAGLRVEPVLCVGDIVDGPGDANATIRSLRDRGVVCVAGNHERWFLHSERRTLQNATLDLAPDALAFLSSLPAQRRFSTPAGQMLLCHGVGSEDEAWLRPDTRGYALREIGSLHELMLNPSVQFMIGGHTHERMVRQFGGLTVVNAGTIHRDFEQTFTIVDFATMRVEFRSAAENSTGTLIEDLPLPPPAALR